MEAYNYVSIGFFKIFPEHFLQMQFQLVQDTLMSLSYSLQFISKFLDVISYLKRTPTRTAPFKACVSTKYLVHEKPKYVKVNTVVVT